VTANASFGACREGHRHALRARTAAALARSGSRLRRPNKMRAERHSRSTNTIRAKISPACSDTIPRLAAQYWPSVETRHDSGKASNNPEILNELVTRSIAGVFPSGRHLRWVRPTTRCRDGHAGAGYGLKDWLCRSASRRCRPWPARQHETSPRSLIAEKISSEMA